MSEKLLKSLETTRGRTQPDDREGARRFFWDHENLEDTPSRPVWNGERRIQSLRTVGISFDEPAPSSFIFLAETRTRLSNEAIVSL